MSRESSVGKSDSPASSKRPWQTPRIQSVGGRAAEAGVTYSHPDGAFYS
ncbi:MAG TPA: hypothetical protein VGD66_00150 [Allosphingosinicella sp.]|jgi:hypothetical protein